MLLGEKLKKARKNPGNWSKQADRIQLVEKNRLGRTAKLDEQEEYGAAVRRRSAAGSTKSGRYC